MRAAETVQARPWLPDDGCGARLAQLGKDHGDPMRHHTAHDSVRQAVAEPYPAHGFETSIPTDTDGISIAASRGVARPCDHAGSMARATVRAWVVGNVTTWLGHGLFVLEAYRSVTFHGSHVP